MPRKITWVKTKEDGQESPALFLRQDLSSPIVSRHAVIPQITKKGKQSICEKEETASARTERS